MEFKMIKIETINKYYEDLKKEFQIIENKEFSHIEGLRQCKTRKGCFVYGKLIMTIELLDRQ